MTSTRIHWLDYTKGIGIFLVVLGHTLRAMVNAEILEPSITVNALDRWIYAFHMPLFFFISGLLIEKSSSKPFKKFLIDKLKVIAYPYLLWSVIQSILTIAASKYTNHKMSWGELSRILYNPVMQFWFLYVLFIIVLAYAIARKLNMSPEVFLGCCIVGLILKGFHVSLGTWGVLYLVREFAIYLGIGAAIGSKLDLEKLRQIPTFILLGMSSTGFILVGLAVQFNLTGQLFTQPVFAMLGSMATIALAILMERFHLFSFIKEWGTLSMAIYLIHTIASALFRTILLKIFGIEDPIFHLIIQTFVGLYIPVFIYIICVKCRFSYIFRWP